MDDSECDDENECTTNTCNPFGDLCDTDPVMNETPCGPPGQDGLVLARCENGQCLPDLCLNRDCGDPDGNSCTGVCISPYGFCDDDANLPNGTTCENTGECFNGECLPTIPRCQRDSDCEDFNDCTEDRCQATFCDFDSLPNGTPCGLNGQCFFGGCLDFF
ncbi:MAG: hypothetical protein HKN10_00325 [Myxococcales bacterium]|nr:hypothetical protein [Myxococcales bacterium]